MATVRRLSDDDVKTVFECIYSNKPPPNKSLRFHIVPVGPEGLRLSPPSYQFQDGLYVLLKPEKKASRETVVRKKVPSNLQGLVVSENAFPVESCPWSLSGPQFPQPTGIQQRYCYPKGDPNYSSNKGGALWTMFINGKEDTEYRLLHVYHSPKRAINKGLTPCQVDRSTGSSARSAMEAIISPFVGSFVASPIQRHRAGAARQNVNATQQVTPDQINSSPDRLKKRSPIATPNSDKKKVQKSTSASPGNFPMPPHPHHQHYYFGHHPQFVPYPFMSPVPVFATPGYPTCNINAAGREIKNTPPNSNAPNHQQYQRQHQQPRVAENSPVSQGLTSSVASDVDDLPSIEPYVPSPIEEANIMLEFESCWLDPIPLHADQQNTQEQLRSFSTKLNVIHESIKEKILEAPKESQAHFSEVFASWARNIAQSPLSPNNDVGKMGSITSPVERHGV